MEFEPLDVNKANFMDLPVMLEALMAKLEQVDENYKSLNTKIDENAKAFNAKIDENSKTLNSKMQNKLEGISEVLGNLEMQVNKGLEKADENDAVKGKLETLDENGKLLSWKIDQSTKSLTIKIDENYRSFNAKMDVMEKMLVEIWEVLNSTQEPELNQQLEKVEGKSNNVKPKIEQLNENGKTLSAKMVENAKSMSVKIDEMVKIIDAKMEKKHEETKQSNLETSNILYKQLQENTKVLNNLEIQVKKQLEKIEQMSEDVGRKDEKMEENTKSLSAKIAENAKTLNAKMEKKLNKIYHVNLKSSNTTKSKLQEMSKVLSAVEIQANKQFKMVEQKSTEMVKSNTIMPPEQTYNVNLGLIASEGQKCHLEMEFRNLIAKINSKDGVVRKLNFGRTDNRALLEAHKSRFKKGVKFRYRTNNNYSIIINNFSCGLSPNDIDDFFSTIPVPPDFSSFITIIFKKIDDFDEFNEEYDLSKPIDVI